MIKRRQLAFFLKIVLISSFWFLSLPALADDQVPSQPQKSYKGEVSPPPGRKFYKDEQDTTDYAANYVPREAKYGGQVYNSDLYEGPLEGPGYSPADSRSLHDGFYMGAEIGYDSYKLRSNIDAFVGTTSVFQQTPDLNAVGLSYTVVGGFGRVFDDPLYLGAELFYNNSQANTSQNVGVVEGEISVYNIKSLVQGSYGVSFLPGFKLGPSVLLFLKGGYTRIEVKTYETSDLLGINNGQSNGANGFNYGLGFEATLYKNWSLRGEYTHVNCESFTTSVGTQITASNNQFMFGVFYHFI